MPDGEMNRANRTSFRQGMNMFRDRKLVEACKPRPGPIVGVNAYPTGGPSESALTHRDTHANQEKSGGIKDRKARTGSRTKPPVLAFRRANLNSG
jgi:hypothetical protein